MTSGTKQSLDLSVLGGMNDGAREGSEGLVMQEEGEGRCSHGKPKGNWGEQRVLQYFSTSALEYRPCALRAASRDEQGLAGASGGNLGKYQ